ncbi:hypothetical protein HQ529_00815 [Candidatus Woesearchaeota archaeon]|nr:hypothetical protein [Candidatus Woesearchaeota archaeon]
MSLTLEQIEKIMEIGRERKVLLKPKKEEPALKKILQEITGEKYELEDLLNLLPIEEDKEHILGYEHSIFSKYADALSHLGRTLYAEKRIGNLIKDDVLLEGDDLDSLQRNIAKFLTRDKEILESFDEKEWNSYYLGKGLKLFLQKLYKHSGKPETQEDKANLLLDIPMEYFGLDEAAKSLLRGKLISSAIRDDYNKEDSPAYDMFNRFFEKLKEVKQSSKDYFDVINTLNSNLNLRQTKVAELGGLPLSATFHEDKLYSIIYDEKQFWIAAYSLNGKLIGKRNLKKLRAPFSLAGYKDNLILVNNGFTDILDTKIDDNEIIIDDIEMKEEKCGDQRTIGTDKLIKIEKNHLQKFEGETRNWKLQSIKTMDDYIAAVLYNSEIGQYVIALKQGDLDLTFTDGNSISTSLFGGVSPNSGDYREKHTAIMSMGGVSFPPDIAMLNNGILITEEKSIRIVNYDLKNVQHYKLGEDEFKVLDKLIPFSSIAGGGDYFGIYANFKIEEENQERTTPPIFLLFSMNEDYKVNFEGALKTESIPINIATGIDISPEGYLAISGKGGVVSADVLSSRDYKYHRIITEGSLELHKLNKIPKLENKVTRLLTD